MAKPKAGSKTSNTGAKVTFGKKSGTGKAKKHFGPKEQKPKYYRGQGR